MYKVIYNNIIIDIIRHPYYVRWIGRFMRPFPTDVTSANGIASSDGETYYHVDTMPPFPSEQNYKTVSLVEITEEEYNTLSSQLTDKKIIYEQEPTEVERLKDTVEQLKNTINQLQFQNSSLLEEVRTVNPIQKSYEEMDLHETKDWKISEMSAACNKTITDGFDVTLSDGVTRHFSLSTQDQLNLITLSTLLATTEQEVFPYHADGEVCGFYSRADTVSIMNKATEFKTIHVTYFNSLKSYISSLEEKEKIKNIYYGMKIPVEYQTDVLKSLDYEKYF